MPHRRVSRRGLQILADCQKINLGGAQIVHHLQHFGPLLPQAHHDARLGEHGGIESLDVGQKAQRVEVARPGADRRIETRHRLQIVVEDIGARPHHGLHCARLAPEIRRQHLDCRAG